MAREPLLGQTVERAPPPAARPRAAQVTHTALKSGGKLESSLVLVGVGARPNVELFKGESDV